MAESVRAIDASRLPPRASGFDDTAALRADPCRFIGREAARLGRDVFRTRPLLRRTICMTEPDAAAIFHDRSRFAHHRAAPEPLRATLFGKGAVQGLGGASHRHRKAMLMSLMSQERIARLGDPVDEGWGDDERRWAQHAGPFALYDAVRTLLARVVCAWCAVPLRERDVEQRTRQLTALFEAAASAGPAHLRARLARTAIERWLSGLVREVRDGRLPAPPDSALAVVASQRHHNGDLLAARVVAAELLNVLQAVVAVAVYVAFVAHALHAHPAWRERLRDGSDHAGNASRLFVQEVRRHYPFFPAVIARVRDSFEWNGWWFPRRTRTLLDLHGTNHDARRWRDPERFDPERFDPERFDPERFAGREPDRFELTPQGGGDPWRQHRCAGEWITIELMRRCALRPARMDYEVPARDPAVDFRRLPALPANGFRLRVRLGAGVTS